MRIGTSPLLDRAWIGLAGTVVLAGPVWAGGGGDVWGTLVWSAAVSGLGLLGLTILAATAAWMLRKRRPLLALTGMLGLVADPLVGMARGR